MGCVLQPQFSSNNLLFNFVNRIMEELKKMLAVLTSDHLEVEKSLDDVKEKGKSLLMKLASGIYSGKYTSDIDALKDLYGNVGHQHAFLLLKSKLRHKILATLLLSEIKTTTYSPREALGYQLNKLLIDAHLLLNFGARDTGIKLLNKIIAQAKRSELNDILLQSLRLLRPHYWHLGEIVTHKKISIEINRVNQVVSNEIKAEEAYQEITILFAKSNAKRSYLVKELAVTISDLEHISKNYASFTVSINILRLRILSFQLQDKHDEVISECKKAILFLKKNRHLSNNILQAFFLLTECEAYSSKRMDNEVIKSISRLHRIIPDRSPNKVALDTLAFIAFTRLGKFSEAKHIIDNTFQVPTFMSLPEHTKEEWLIYRNYLSIIMQLKEGNTVQFINSTNNAKSSSPNYKLATVSKDKLGRNVTKVILETLEYILSRNYNKLQQIDKSLDNYLYRYLNGNKDYVRTITFLTMLRIVIREELDTDQIRKKSAKYLNKLQAISKSNMIEPIEILPYETLWLLLLEAI